MLLIEYIEEKAYFCGFVKLPDIYFNIWKFKMKEQGRIIKINFLEWLRGERKNSPWGR